MSKKHLSLDELIEEIGYHLPKLEGGKFDSSEGAKAYFILKLAHCKREHLEVAYLNSNYEVIKCQRMFSGTLGSSAVYPREIARRALELNAAAIMLAHNHPSGNLRPSDSDIRITNRISDALGLFDINVLDHVIVGGNQATTFSERGILP